MSKRATECVIEGGELGVGRQLALDSMKPSAIHSLYPLLDWNIIHSIITEMVVDEGRNTLKDPL